MRLLINGESCEYPQPLTLKKILQDLSYDSNSIAIAVGKTFVPRDQWDKRYLENDEEVEIVTPMQGG